MKDTVLILGATGRLGRNAATAFENDGWEVRRFDRKTDNLWDAAWGANVIVNGWNMAYTKWATEIPELTQQVIEVAQASGATVIIPGNVYVYGETTPQRMSIDTPHAATNPLGRIRIEMEQAYRDAGVKTIILRAGDYIDTHASGNWFDLIMAKSVAKGVFTYPGETDIPHAFAYLPDVAAAMVALANRKDTLGVFEDVGFPGFTLSGEDFGRAIRDTLDRPITVKQMAWWPLILASPFWAEGRNLIEMRYLWDTPHRIDAARFEELVPDFNATQITDALRGALSELVQNKVHPNKPMATGGASFTA